MLPFQTYQECAYPIMFHNAGVEEPLRIERVLSRASTAELDAGL